uniref:Charged multivesicular body protein 6 n=1 Tax=Heterorhabditis bacteriophora TaxID=37862 RepID=A0A1I7XND8_HETBA
MGGLFSKKPQSSKAFNSCEITEQDQAILQLKSQRDKIKQFIKRKEKCIDRERILARQLIKDGKKDRALLLLKKKRYQENVIDQTLRELDNIDRMVQDLEFSEIQKRVVDGLRNGNEALKKMNAIFDFEEIERILDETREGAEYQEEINIMISGQLSSTDIMDVEKELDELLSDQLEITITMPDVPTQELMEDHSAKKKKVAVQT